MARKHGVDPDMVRAIIWVETARGHKGIFNDLADKLGLSDTQMPMNINGDIWSGLIGVPPEALKDPVKNIEAGTVLIKRIGERVKNPTAAKIGSIWNYSGREEVNDLGARIGRVYREKPWKSRN